MTIPRSSPIILNVFFIASESPLHGDEVNHGQILFIGLVVAFIIGLVVYWLSSDPRKNTDSTDLAPQDTAKNPADSKPPSYRSTFGSHTCTHEPFGSPKMLTIKGKSVGVGGSPFCVDCTVEYFNKYSTVCDKCGDTICPAMPVGQHYEVQSDGSEKLVTTCQKMDCALPGNLVGQWGEGKINEMNWGSGGKSRLHKSEDLTPEPDDENIPVI